MSLIFQKKVPFLKECQWIREKGSVLQHCFGAIKFVPGQLPHFLAEFVSGIFTEPTL